MQRVVLYLVILILWGCSSTPKDTSVHGLLTQGEDEGYWKLEQRWIDDELEVNGPDLRMMVGKDGSLDINGHKTTYQLHEEGKYMEFSYEYEEVHDYYVTILHVSVSWGILPVYYYY